MRIFDSEHASPYYFFVQAKSAGSIARYTRGDQRYIRYPITQEHLSNWMMFAEPVMVSVWDSESNETYWETVQDAEKAPDTSGKSAYLYIPVDNKLDTKGVARIESRVKTRFSRLEDERHGAQILIDLLREHTGMEIDYNPRDGFLYISRPDQTGQLIAFGRGAERLAELEKSTGIPVEDLLPKALEGLLQLTAAREIEIVDRDGSTVQSWKSWKELARFVDRQEELRTRHTDGGR